MWRISFPAVQLWGYSINSKMLKIISQTPSQFWIYGMEQSSLQTSSSSISPSFIPSSTFHYSWHPPVFAPRCAAGGGGSKDTTTDSKARSKPPSSAWVLLWTNSTVGDCHPKNAKKMSLKSILMVKFNSSSVLPFGEPNWIFCVLGDVLEILDY